MKTAVQIAEERVLLEELELLQKVLLVKEQEQELRKCEADPWYWFQKYVWTADEIDPFEPIKKYPDWEFLHDYCRIWQAYPDIRLIAIEKSRRVLGTLSFVGLFLWDALFNDARVNIITSTNEEKANIQIERRAWVMYQHLPEWMRLAVPARRVYCKLIVPGKDVNPNLEKKSSSLIWSVPQENEQARGETASNYLFDEVVAQSQAERNYMAAMPAVEVGKRIGPRIVLISTTGTGFFDRLVHDKL